MSLEPMMILCLIFYISPSVSFLSSKNYFSSTFSKGASIQASTMVMPPADLTPAVDKFVRLPPDTKAADPYFMTAKGPVPKGPEPFSMVANELQPLSEYVKELVVSENPVLTKASQHFFDQVSHLF